MYVMMVVMYITGYCFLYQEQDLFANSDLFDAELDDDNKENQSGKLVSCLVSPMQTCHQHILFYLIIIITLVIVRSC